MNDLNRNGEFDNISNQHFCSKFVIFQVDFVSIGVSHTLPVEAPLTWTEWSSCGGFPLPTPASPTAPAGVCLLHPAIPILGWGRVPPGAHHPRPPHREICGRTDNAKPRVHPHICLLPCPSQEGDSTQPGPFDPEKARRAAALSWAGGGHG